ncbi:MAG TPA: hypothetical protein VG733_15500 [Chthoniobacteraceae bacterium]|nr:hypothetical protein [Chthoniobacteraceae bacterium]
MRDDDPRPRVEPRGEQQKNTDPHRDAVGEPGADGLFLGGAFHREGGDKPVENEREPAAGDDLVLNHWGKLTAKGAKAAKEKSIPIFAFFAANPFVFPFSRFRC